MTERSQDHRSLHRLRDFSGELRRGPRTARRTEFQHLLRDDGRLDRHEQLRIFATLLPPQNRSAVGRFALMLTLSVTIAVMGLAANSTAVVIGAMLIAPLMTPIMTFSASVGLGLGKRAIQAAFLVGAGAVWSVVFAAILARLLPTVTIGSELLARTRPDVRDLVVAIAAGAAGAYATARADVSAALPGVAVAVALVPPLAATGVLLEEHRRVLAEGSALLFVTNLLAIIVSALAVLLITGVVPTIRLCLQSSRIALTAVGLTVATVLVAIPLTTRSLDAANSSRQQSAIAATVTDWLGDLRLDVNSIALDARTVTVEVTGLDEPPAAFDLARQLVPLLGDKAEAIVRWDQRAQGEARADSPPAADPAQVARGVVENWVAVLADEGVRLDVLDVTYRDGAVDVVVSGPAAPPAAPDLPDQVAQAVGKSVVLNVRWIQSFDPGLDGEPPATRLDRLVRAWIGPRSSVRVLATSIDGSTVIVDLGADGRPLGLETLQHVALTAVQGAERVEIRLLPLTHIDVTPDPVEIPSLV